MFEFAALKDLASLGLSVSKPTLRPAAYLFLLRKLKYAQCTQKTSHMECMMFEKFSMTLYSNDRGFYVNTKVHRPKMDYVQSANYGPLSAEEVLQLFADCPVPVVVDMAQRRLF